MSPQAAGTCHHTCTKHVHASVELPVSVRCSVGRRGRSHRVVPPEHVPGRTLNFPFDLPLIPPSLVPALCRAVLTNVHTRPRSLCFCPPPVGASPLPPSSSSLPTFFCPLVPFLLLFPPFLLLLFLLSVILWGSLSHSSPHPSSPSAVPVGLWAGRVWAPAAFSKASAAAPATDPSNAATLIPTHIFTSVERWE